MSKKKPKYYTVWKGHHTGVFETWEDCKAQITNYDGAIIFQAKCDVLATDSAEDVAAKIHELEMAHFPKVVEGLLK